MSIQDSIIKTLKTGKMFTANQMAGLFNTTAGTVRARISDLRTQGHNIVNSVTKNGKGAYQLNKTPVTAMRSSVKTKTVTR